MSAAAAFFMLATAGGVVALNVYCVLKCLRGKKK
jgi:hypothetical protein